MTKNPAMTRKQTKIHIDKIIGRNIAKERASRNITRDELANLIEMTSSHMGLIERGERGATAVTLSKLSEVLDMPIDALFTADIHKTQTTATKAKYKKISSLTTNLTDAELDLTIHTIQGIIALSRRKQ